MVQFQKPRVVFCNVQDKQLMSIRLWGFVEDSSYFLRSNCMPRFTEASLLGYDHFIDSRCSSPILISCIKSTIIATFHPTKDLQEFSSGHVYFYNQPEHRPFFWQHFHHVRINLLGDQSCFCYFIVNFIKSSHV